MASTRVLAKTAIVLYALCFIANSDGKAVMKRSVSEMQIMHDLGEHLESVNRQKWLLEKLQTVHHDPQAAEGIAGDAKPREVRSWRLLPGNLQVKIQKKSKDWNKGYKDTAFKAKPQ